MKSVMLPAVLQLGLLVLPVLVIPVAGATLGEALEYAGAEWTTGGSAPWTGLHGVPGAEGDDAAATPVLSPNEEVWLETTVPAGGELKWRWRFGLAGDGGDFVCLLDGLPLKGKQKDSGHAWGNEEWILPPGPHTVRWRYVAEDPWKEGGQAMVDAVSFTPAAPPGWEAALGTLGAECGGSGLASWSLVEDDGTPALTTTVSPTATHGSVVFLDVTGPALVHYRFRASYEFKLRLDGRELWADGDDGWHSYNQLIPQGRHRMAWEQYPAPWNVADSMFWLRQLAVTPLTTVSLTEALEAGAVTFIDEPASPWLGVSVPGLKEDNDFAAVIVPAYETRMLEAEFTGPGVLYGVWDWSPFGGRSSMELMEGDNILGRYGPGVSGTPRTISRLFGPGVHRVKLPIHSDTGFFEVRLNPLMFTPWPAVDIATAVDAPERVFTTGGDGWTTGIVSPELAAEGESVVWMQAEPFTSTWTETVVPGPADVSFWCRVSGQYRAAMELSVDGARQIIKEPLSGESSGVEIVRVPAGVHTVRWKWNFNGRSAEPGRLNALLLDKLGITPVTPPSLAEAADRQGLAFSPVTGDWTGLESPNAHAGGDYIQAWRGNSTPISTNLALTGPGVLRWWWEQIYSSDGEQRLFAMLDGIQMAIDDRYQIGWQPAVMAIPPGIHTVTFTVGYGSPGEVGRFDEFAWYPTSAATTLTTAAEGNGLTNWSAGAPGDWFPVEDPALAFDGQHSLLASRAPAGVRRLNAAAQGPGTLTFLTRSSLYSDYFSLHVDGNRADPQKTDIAPGDWFRAHRFIGGGGAHSVSWIVDSSDQQMGSLNAVLLDNVSYTAAAPATLSVALDQQSWNFRTGGSEPWLGAESPVGLNGNVGYTVLCSDQPAAEQWIETDFAGPGRIFFEFRPAPGAGSVTIDGVADSPFGSVGTNAPGNHTIRWTVRQPATAVNATVTLDGLHYFPSTWEGWVAYHFPAGAPPADISFTADPDNDGAANGVEAVLGTSPLIADRDPPLEIRIVSGGSPQVKMNYSAYPPYGLRIAIESAPAGSGPWAPVAQATPPGSWNGSFVSGYNTATQNYVVHNPPPGGARRCFRLRVTKTVP